MSHSYGKRGRPVYRRRRLPREHLKILDAVIAGRAVNHGIPNETWESR